MAGNRDQRYLDQLLRSLREINEQEDWIKHCGGDLQGYISRYGKAADPTHYGDGAEAIFAADTAELQRREKRHRALIDKHQFGIRTQDEGRTFVIDITPRWQDLINGARGFAAGTAGAPALNAILDELNRLAKIADGEDPDVILAARES